MPVRWPEGTSEGLHLKENLPSAQAAGDAVWPKSPWGFKKLLELRFSKSSSLFNSWYSKYQDPYT